MGINDIDRPGPPRGDPESGELGIHPLLVICRCECYRAISPQQGFSVNLAETSQSEGVSPVSFTLIAPDNTLVRVRGSPAPASKTAWKPGDMVYIYQNGGGLYYAAVVL